MLTIPYLTIGTQLPAAPAASTGGPGYYLRRTRWMYAALVLLLLF